MKVRGRRRGRRPKPAAAGAVRRPTAAAGRGAGSAPDPRRRLQRARRLGAPVPVVRGDDAAAVRRKVGFEYELGAVPTQKNPTHGPNEGDWVDHAKGEVIEPRRRYDITADIGANQSQIEFVTDQFDEENPSEVRELGLVAQDIAWDLKAIAHAGRHVAWVPASQVPRVQGSPWHRFSFIASSYDALGGQLQMTGGVALDRLASIVSGAALGQQPVGGGQTTHQDVAQNYQSMDVPGNLKQPIYHTASLQVNGFIGHLPGRVRGMLAAVITLMAQIPLNARGDLNMPDQAQFLARTDFAKMMKMIGDDAGLEINAGHFATALVNTVNAHASNPVAANDDVFPATYVAAGQQLTGVSIGQWARSVVPTPGRFWGRWQGTDLITRANFPGTRAQKDVLRPFGGFGSRTDPGQRPVLEWRNFRVLHPDDLAPVMVGLAGYLEEANQ